MDKLAARDRAAATEARIQAVRAHIQAAGVRVRRVFDRGGVQIALFVLGFVAVVVINNIIERF